MICVKWKRMRDVRERLRERVWKSKCERGKQGVNEWLRENKLIIDESVPW